MNEMNNYHRRDTMSDNKTPYSGKDYPVHTNGPWRIEGDRVRTSIAAGIKHIAMVNYFNCGAGDPRTITDEEHEANASLISAAPEMLEVLRWLDAEMDCRDGEFGGLFSRSDFEKVRRTIKLAMEGCARGDI
jgi:hypothetical protein